MLSEGTLRKLAMLIPLLASDQPGEVVATAAAIKRTLKSNESDFHTLAKMLTSTPVTRIVYRDAPKPEPTEWAAKAAFCAARAGNLNPKETEFVNDMTVRLKYGSPTERQAAWLDTIWSRLQRREASA